MIRLCEPEPAVDMKYEPLTKMSWLSRSSSVQTPQNVGAL